MGDPLLFALTLGTARIQWNFYLLFLCEADYHWRAKERAVMPTIQIDTEQLLHAALQLPRSELDQFVTRLLVLRIQHNTPRLTQDEAELLLKINEDLPPAVQQRLDELISKRQTQSLIPAEHQELIHLTEQSEKVDADRMQHLLVLAALRNVSLDEVMRQLGIHPVLHD